jgi:hypothetical protein
MGDWAWEDSFLLRIFSPQRAPRNTKGEEMSKKKPGSRKKEAEGYL